MNGSSYSLAFPLYQLNPQSALQNAQNGLSLVVKILIFLKQIGSIDDLIVVLDYGCSISNKLWVYSSSFLAIRFVNDYWNYRVDVY